ncbi:hypothetical protein BDV11DRAFT_210602 [Aspergillus similis]
MRAWIHKSRNLPLEKGMELVEQPRPTDCLRPNEIFIKVKCVGSNPADNILAEMTWPGTAMIRQAPLPGMVFSGEVISTGRNFTIAELEWSVRMPPGIDFEQAASVGTAAITGDSVFISEGTGGVGAFAIQFAESLGYRVTVTCSTTKTDLSKELGADRVIDYRTQDSVGKEPICTEPQIGLSSGTARICSVQQFGWWRGKFKVYFVKSNRAGFEQIAEWMGVRKVPTPIDTVFESSDMAKAIEKIKSGAATGKIVVRV